MSDPSLKKLKICLSTDHAGFEKMHLIKDYLEKNGHTCLNYGPHNYDKDDDYPDFIRPAAEVVARGECDLGIILGASGQGEAMVANRVKGVRCAVYYGPAHALAEIDASGKDSTDHYDILRLTKQHNNANILSLAGRFIEDDEMLKVIDIWLETEFSGESRHERRIKKIDD